MTPARGELRPLFTWRSAITESDLPPTTRHVALTLSLHMNERGGSCFPSQETLAKETGLSARAVGMHLHKLEDDGYLTVEVDRKGREQRGGGRYKTTHWLATTPTNPERRSGFSTAAEGENPEPHSRNDVQGIQETPNLATRNPEPHDRNPEPRSDKDVVTLQEDVTLSASATPGGVEARKPDPLAAAKAIVNPWWESPGRQPTATPYIAIVKRVKDCLDGGFEAEAVAAALRELRVFTTGSFEWKLSQVQRTRAPETWDVLQRRLAEHAAHPVEDREVLPA